MIHQERDLKTKLDQICVYLKREKFRKKGGVITTNNGMTLRQEKSRLNIMTFPNHKIY